jgi:hypothetical protein
MPKTLFLAITNPVPGRVDEFHEWYEHQHLDDVLAVDGVVAAQRFEIVPGVQSLDLGFQYAAIYEIADGMLDSVVAEFEAARIEREAAPHPGAKVRLPVSPALDKQTRRLYLRTLSDRRAKGA